MCFVCGAKEKSYKSLPTKLRLTYGFSNWLKQMNLWTATSDSEIWYQAWQFTSSLFHFWQTFTHQISLITSLSFVHLFRWVATISCRVLLWTWRLLDLGIIRLKWSILVWLSLVLHWTPTVWAFSPKALVCPMGCEVPDVQLVLTGKRWTQNSTVGAGGGGRLASVVCVLYMSLCVLFCVFSTHEMTTNDPLHACPCHGEPN